MSNFLLYMLGAVIVAGALGYGAYLLGFGSTWIAILVAFVIGFGIMGGAKKARRNHKVD